MTKHDEIQIHRIKAKDVPEYRERLLEQQNHLCPLCGGSLDPEASKNPALDHCHVTGFLRDVLCINCNAMEGKVFNLAQRAKGDLTPQQWLQNLIEYYHRHATPQHGGILHHTHKTEEEKRLRRNVRARKARAKKKAQQAQL
jgi:hypothetical protein